MDSGLAREDVPLFVYGTLCFDDVLRRLLGRVPARRPARLPGWRAAALAGRPYPGLVPAPGGAARGVLMSGLTPRENAVLDAFEGSEYAQRTVTPTGETAARVYVWLEPDGPDVLAADWDARVYARRVLAAYGSAAPPFPAHPTDPGPQSPDGAGRNPSGD